MKSIDEMSIPDLLYRVRYSILPCYGQEILSRFAEKDKRIAELEKLPQIKYIYGLITKIAELEKQIESLKCCGNCKNHYIPDLAVPCKSMCDFSCCDNWTSDCLTKEKRYAETTIKKKLEESQG